MASKPAIARKGIIGEIDAKLNQLRVQILGGLPPDYPAYRAAIGGYKALEELRAFAVEQAKEGDVVDEN